MRERISKGTVSARVRLCALALTMLTAALLAGCGSSSSSSSNTTPANTPASGTASSQPSASSGSPVSPAAREAPTTTKPAHLPSGIVAKVDGTPITLATYDHSLQISASGPVKSLIANASDYSGCTSALKAREARTEKLIKAEEEEFAKRSKGRSKEAGRLRENRKPKTAAQLKEQCELQYTSAKQQALSSLIRRVQTQLEAKQLGVSVNESEVAKQLKAREASQKALAKNSRASRFGVAEAPEYTAADLKELIATNQLETQIQAKLREKFAKAGSLSQSKLEKYFNEHKQLYGQPEKRSIVFANTKSQSAAEAIAKEHGGLSAAAGKHSVTATPASVGCEHAAGVKLSSIYSAICSAKTGVLTGPVKMSSNYYVFELKSTTPAVKPSFAQVKERIKQQLSSQGEEQGMFKYSEELRTKLKNDTECAAGYIVFMCKEYVTPKVRAARPLTKR
jgi:PPIC-type PPIASE domain